ncbi:MAG: 4'-phosphopantetheinyl transferase superfamily protein [Bacillota bacterium]|nr:4'-phosphopantetheinyl transferase superfamily protein [Bacillota bacterium]
MQSKEWDIHLFLYRRPWDQPLLPHSDLLLARAGALFSGAEGGWSVCRPPGEKPFFAHRPELHFSLSHSGDFWLCAMSRQELGLDLQQQRVQQVERLSRRFFSPQELDFLQQQDYADFFSVWAAKEAFVKHSGRGIRQDFGSFSVAGPQGLLEEVAGLQLRQLPFLPGYSLCLCAERLCCVLLRLLSLR